MFQANGFLCFWLLALPWDCGPSGHLLMNQPINSVVYAAVHRLDMLLGRLKE